LKRTACAVALSVLALAACRGIVGIEALSIEEAGVEVDAGPDASSVTGADAASAGDARDATASGDAHDAASHADASDAGMKPDANEAGPSGCSASARAACLTCCANDNGPGVMAILATGSGQCLCGPSGVCRSGCAASVCEMTMPDESCLSCLGSAFFGNGAPCASYVSECSSSACQALAECANACPP
jgi:hypothetical protein